MSLSKTCKPRKSVLSWTSKKSVQDVIQERFRMWISGGRSLPLYPDPVLEENVVSSYLAWIGDPFIMFFEHSELLDQKYFPLEFLLAIALRITNLPSTPASWVFEEFAYTNCIYSFPVSSLFTSRSLSFVRSTFGNCYFTNSREGDFSEGKPGYAIIQEMIDKTYECNGFLLGGQAFIWIKDTFARDEPSFRLNDSLGNLLALYRPYYDDIQDCDESMNFKTCHPVYFFSHFIESDIGNYPITIRTLGMNARRMHENGASLKKIVRLHVHSYAFPRTVQSMLFKRVEFVQRTLTRLAYGYLLYEKMMDEASLKKMNVAPFCAYDSWGNKGFPTRQEYFKLAQDHKPLYWTAKYQLYNIPTEYIRRSALSSNKYMFYNMNAPDLHPKVPGVLLSDDQDILSALNQPLIPSLPFSTNVAPGLMEMESNSVLQDQVSGSTKGLKRKEIPDSKREIDDED